MPGEPRLLDQVRAALRVRHYSLRTEAAYVQWIRRFILFHGTRHPRELGAEEISSFLSHLATEAQVAASTQNQALNALVFLYRRVLETEVGELENLVRARERRRLPVVLTSAEVHALLGELDGVHRLCAKLLYGAGLRLLECLRLRVKDLDFERLEIAVRDGKGGRDRVTVLPRSAVSALRTQLERGREIHRRDLAEGYGSVFLPDALARKLRGADRSWVWQWAFPSERRSRDPRSGVERRHHLSETGLQTAVKRAAERAKIGKRVTCHALRHYADIGISATALQHISSRTATTSERFRSSWGTAASARP